MFAEIFFMNLLLALSIIANNFVHDSYELILRWSIFRFLNLCEMLFWVGVRKKKRDKNQLTILRSKVAK